MISFNTIGGCIEGLYNVHAHCNACRHRVALDLPALSEKLGRGHSILHDALVPKLRCSQCGSKDIG